MTARAEYTDQEWQLLYLSPWVVGIAVSFAESGGTIRELMTVASLSATVRERYPDNELLGALWSAKQAPAVPPEPTASVDPTRLAGALLESALDTCHKVMALLGERSSAEETEAFRRLLGEVAVAVANSTRTGGVLGLGGVLVTAAERAAVDAIRSALDLEPMSDPQGAGGAEGATTPPPPDVIRGGGPGIPGGSLDPS
jgi:hypothetical protein